jgi:hypothetical protein
MVGMLYPVTLLSSLEEAMSSTSSNLIYHFVFSTKHRKPLIGEPIKERRSSGLSPDQASPASLQDAHSYLPLTWGAAGRSRNSSPTARSFAAPALYPRLHA